MLYMPFLYVHPFQGLNWSGFSFFFFWVGPISFLSGTENLGELVSAVMQRIGAADDQNRPQLLVSWKREHI